MLGKLLKHEWRATWKVPTFLVGLNLFCALAAGASFALPIWDSEWVGLPISAVMVLMLFYFAMIGSTLGITIYMAVRYYKNMFTDEGYLTHTLPATPRQLLLTKVINMSAWSLISVVSVLVGIFGFIVLMLLFLAPDGISLGEAIAEIWVVLDDPMMEGWQLFMVIMILFFFVSAFSGTMMIIGSVNIGQMVRKHRILGAVGAYFAIYTVIQTISMIIMFPMMFGMAFSMENMDEVSVFAIYNPIYGVMMVVFLITTVVLYFVSEYLLRRKLELE
ncbi:MAG: hypothetical protein IJ409_06110 [Lachnospiraceae bacterium]|nr:hypothetical protein [Lachnospiraceae bacterium]